LNRGIKREKSSGRKRGNSGQGEKKEGRGCHTDSSFSRPDKVLISACHEKWEKRKRIMETKEGHSVKRDYN